jgi:hypothetical protein
MRRVGRFDSTTIGFHAQVVSQVPGSSLVVSVATVVDGTPVLPDQAGQVHGL